MTSPHAADDDRALAGAGDDLAGGALVQLREMHTRLERAAAAAARRRSVRDRAGSGWRRARRSGRRVYRYPFAFWRGFRAKGPNTTARADLKALTTLVDEARYDEAVALAAALLPRRSGDPQFLSTARRAFAKAGALSWQVEAVRVERERADSPALQRQAATLAGRVRELDPTWLPEVPTDLTGVRPEPGRVLHVLKASMPYRQSGYTMRSQYVIDGQRAVGLEPVGLTALGFPEDAETAPPRTEVVDGTTYHRLPASEAASVKGPPDAYLQAYAAAAAERLAEIAPSVIHAHSGHRGYESAVVALALGRALGVPVVYEVRGFFESLWSSDTRWNERGELYRRRYERETQCMSDADAVVTLSESMKADIVARGIPAEKVLVVPNGVNVEYFHPKERSAELVDRWGLADAFVFGYVSNLDHYREGHELLVRAAARLRSRGVPAVAMIVGDGRRRQELEELAAREGAGDSVIFTGRVPHTEVLDYYRLLDVFVVPRVDERAARLVTPLKPFEAMAAGVPVVVSDLPALQEITGGQARGRSFPAGDAAALADVLTELHADPRTLQHLAQHGRDWVVAERQWSSNGARYAALYDQLLTGGRGQ